MNVRVHEIEQNKNFVQSSGGKTEKHMYVYDGFNPCCCGVILADICFRDGYYCSGDYQIARLPLMAASVGAARRATLFPASAL